LKTNNRTSDECRISSNFDGHVINFDLKVTAQPFNLKGKKFVMIFLSDISNQKRREQLEKIFLHDLLNVLTGLSGLIEIFPNEGLNSKQASFFSQIKESSHLLVEEFRAQRDLIAAENNTLIINSHIINSIEILKSTIKIVKFQSIAMEKEIDIDSNSVSVMIETDSRLLHRVLLNLVKNALDASAPGDLVNIGCSISDQNIVFWVRNPFVMTESIKSQIFQRSFSTKGTGRGLGTYSVKLLTERYLGGRVDFQSTKEKGTIFYVYLPINGEDHE
jgi:signal transduction histidine kinase